MSAVSRSRPSPQHTLTTRICPGGQAFRQFSIWPQTALSRALRPRLVLYLSCQATQSTGMRTVIAGEQYERQTTRQTDSLTGQCPRIERIYHLFFLFFPPDRSALCFKNASSTVALAEAALSFHCSSSSANKFPAASASLSIVSSVAKSFADSYSSTASLKRPRS